MNKFKHRLLAVSLTMALSICTAFSAFAEFGPTGTSGATASVEGSGTSVNSSNDALIPAESTVAATSGNASTTVDSVSDKLKNTMTAQLTDQIILVNDHNLTLWNRQTDGNWKKDMDVYCGYGRKGLKPFNERREGDETTPIGSFPILHAFGFGSNPGTAMTWREITANSYWSGEKSTYNTWVESSTPVGGEHLIEYNICYKYAMAIGFNINPTVYKRGSAIFLHCKNPESWGSAGCVSVVESDMIELLSRCHNGCYIMIVPDESYISNF